jgi:hypothetical protein
MSIASLENGNLTLNQLVVNNSLYSDVSGYIASQTIITSSKNSTSLTTGNFTTTGTLTGYGVDVKGSGGQISMVCSLPNQLNVIGNFEAYDLTSSVLLNSQGNTYLSGVYFTTLAGPITVIGNSSSLTTMLYPFPSSSITQVMITVGAINTSSGGIIAHADVIAPFSTINSTVQFYFYNPTNSTITISSCSVILYNPLGNGGLTNLA